MKFPRWSRQLLNSLYVIVGVIFIWRGVWAVLDIIEYYFFGEAHLGFSIALIIAGMAFIYLHDHRYDKMDHF